MNLNLGCADRWVSGFVNSDIVRLEPREPVVEATWEYADLSGRWPWGDSSAVLVEADDVIEHVADKIHFMNELYRVLRPNGTASIITPNASRGAGFWQDPTHKSGWCLNSFQYFQSGSFAHGRLAKSYGITAEFQILSLEEQKYMDMHEEVWKITAILQAVKR